MVLIQRHWPAPHLSVAKDDALNRFCPGVSRADLREDVEFVGLFMAVRQGRATI